jgi:predicted Fe-Mo cluster-binding NifX family protein
MKIAIPVANEKLALHFGHCQQFAIINVDQNNAENMKTEFLTPPPHEPGVLPKWLGKLEVDTVIAGGMGMRAQNLFAEQNITVVVGAQSSSPEDIVKEFLNGKLQTGANPCDH